MYLRLLCLAFAILFTVSAAPASAQNEVGPTLSQVLKRGVLSCGVSKAEGFAQPDSTGVFFGFDADLCRAIAAAIFDDPNKAQILELPARERIGSLLTGWVDVLASGPAWTLSRDAGQRVVYAGVSFYDGQGYLVRRQRSFASSKDLNDVSICVQQGTSYELDLADDFHARAAKFQPRFFDEFDAALSAYDTGQCDVLTADISTLNTARVRLGSPQDHTVLPDVLSLAPRGVVVRQGDEQWASIIRWTLYAMLAAEEAGVSRANADEALKSDNPRIRKLLGVDGDRGASLGLNSHWVYRIVKHVGNYAEVFDRNLGQNSPFAMERRQNALWNKGGLMAPPAVR